ncbi:MAG: small multi-drug export protein [Nanoarchaeota archaeon]|nr:small multi-drug export protein [Nanoarchaeota archaeon]
MFKEILILAFIMMLPFVEIRLAIPIGILTGSVVLPFGITLSGFGFHPLAVFCLAIIMGFFLTFIIFNGLHLLDKPLRKSKFSGRYFRLLEKTQKRIHPYIDKYGILGLAVYISLPIPGSGGYMGSIGGYALGFERKKFYLAAIIGVTIAAVIVTSLVVLGKLVL